LGLALQNYLKKVHFAAQAMLRQIVEIPIFRAWRVLLSWSVLIINTDWKSSESVKKFDLPKDIFG
jgi:hypothetical protein